MRRMNRGSKKYINGIIIFLFLNILGSFVFAQSPDLYSYQTIIRNSNNVLVANAIISVRISILSGTAADFLWYEEEHKVKTNLNGQK